jgi:hypothetical protein
VSSLDPRIEAVRERYGLARDDFWELPQKKGTWVAKHAALEVAAVKANIRFDMPVIVEANGGEGVAAVCVQGEMEGRFEWSLGEASPKNNKNAYPWAMAEKRAKDRVILKLIGIHGLIYSEEEADDFKASRPAPAVGFMADGRNDAAKEALKQQLVASTREPPPDEPLKTRYKYGNISVAMMRDLWTEMRKVLDGCYSLDELAAMWLSRSFQDALKQLSPGWRDYMLEHKQGCVAIFEAAKPVRTLGDRLDQMEQEGAGGPQ